MKIRRNIQLRYQKNVVKKNRLVYYKKKKKGDRHYFSIKDFNTSAYNHTLHRGKKPFCHYCLKAFSTEEIFKLYIKDCLKTSSKERIIFSKKDESVNLKMMKENKSHHL